MSLRLNVVIKLALHLPIAEIELPLRATVETSAISSAFAGKRTAELPVPAAKYSCYETCDFYCQRLHDLYLSKSPELSVKR